MTETVKNLPAVQDSWAFLFFFFLYLYFIYFSFIFIHWRLITLQYCNGFCHTLTWMLGLIPGLFNLLEEGMAAHSRNFAWRIPMVRSVWQPLVCGRKDSDTTEWLRERDWAITLWAMLKLQYPLGIFVSVIPNMA